MKNVKIGIIGSGQVAKVLGNGFLKYGAEVMLSSRNPEKLMDWLSSTGDNAWAGSFEEAAAFGDILVLAVGGVVAEEVIIQLGSEHLRGKTIIDVTNPIAQEAPVNGVLKYFTRMDESLMERLQRREPEARFVKAFNCVGNAHMINPKFEGGTPTMFICGDDESAKEEVTQILDTFGWETEDMGGAEAARAIEPLCMLWCIPGFRENRWNHAFKLLKG